MAEFIVTVGEGLEVGLMVTEGNDGRTTSVIYLQEVGSNRMIGLNNIEALNLAQELIALASVNDDGGQQSNSEALEQAFLTGDLR